MTKTIFDYTHVKNTTAVTLLNAKTKEYCGRIVANWSNNPAGTVCTACVMLYGNGPSEAIKAVVDANQKAMKGNFIGKAGGYGYDKLSSAIYSSLKAQGLEKLIKVESASGNQRQAFEEAGFIYIEVC